MLLISCILDDSRDNIFSPKEYSRRLRSEKTGRSVKRRINDIRRDRGELTAFPAEFVMPRIDYG